MVCVTIRPTAIENRSSYLLQTMHLMEHTDTEGAACEIEIHHQIMTSHEFSQELILTLRTQSHKPVCRLKSICRSPFRPGIPVRHTILFRVLDFE